MNRARRSEPMRAHSLSPIALSPIVVLLALALITTASYWTSLAARGWGGDRPFLVGDETGAPAAPGLDWITAWDTTGDREEFVDAMRKHRSQAPGFDVWAEGRVAAFASVGAAASFPQDGRVWT